MKFQSLAPFVPSGSDFECSKLFFRELGFTINWDAGGYAGFEKDGCKFILQQYDNKAFAENLMISVKTDDAQEFWKFVVEKNYPNVLASVSMHQGNSHTVKKSTSLIWQAFAGILLSKIPALYK